MGAVLPLTDLDIEVLAHARADGRLPALVPSPEVARATYDKYEAHLLLEPPLGLPSPPTVLPEGDLEALAYPVMVKPRRGSGARSIHLAARRLRRRASSSATSPSRRWCSGRWAARSCRSTASATSTAAA